MIFYLLLFIAALVVFKYVWQPWRLHKWYAENFKKQGYKVFEVPFQPFGAPLPDYSNMPKDETIGI